jgi:hypothetical protein
MQAIMFSKRDADPISIDIDNLSEKNLAEARAALADGYVPIAQVFDLTHQIIGTGTLTGFRKMGATPQQTNIYRRDVPGGLPIILFTRRVADPSMPGR